MFIKYPCNFCYYNNRTNIEQKISKELRHEHWANRIEKAPSESISTSFLAQTGFSTKQILNFVIFHNYLGKTVLHNQTRLFIHKKVHPIAPKYETQDQTVQIGKFGIRNLLKIQGAIKQMICWHWLTIRLFAKKGQWNAKSCFANCQGSIWILFMYVVCVPKNVNTNL